MKADWKIVALGDVADVFNGKTPSKAEQRPAGHPVLKIKDVSELGQYRGKFESFVDPKLAAKLSEKRVRAGDTLILNAAHNADYVASKTYHAQPPTFGALATGEWLIVRPSEKLVDAGFVHHWVNSSYTRRRLRELVNGIHLYPKDVVRLKLGLPPMAEQRRIAEVLDRAEALRAKRRAALAQLDSLTQSIFFDLFGDPTAIAPRHPSHPLGCLLGQPLQNGAYFPRERYCAEGGVEMVHMSDAFYDLLVRGRLKRVMCEKADIERYSLSDSDILVSRRSLNYEGAAKPCLIPKSDQPLIFESSFIRVTPSPERVTVLYLFHYLSNERVRQKSVHPFVTQSTISGINQSNLARVPVMVPPIELQHDFARRVRAVEKLKTAQRASQAEMDALFATLQHRAFRGEL